MARVRDEKQVRRDYQQLKQAMADLYDRLGTPELYSRDHLFWMTQSYMVEHDLEMTAAVERVAKTLKEQRVALHLALYPDKEHQHVWQKLSVNGWACRTCPALGKWDGNDSTPMEVTK